MNVVVRSVQAAGMAVYAAMHVLQAASSPASSPRWLTLAFAVTAVAAVVIAAGLVLARTSSEARWERAAALLALASAVALLMSYTTGFFGVVETDLRGETALVAVAELVTIVAYVLGTATQAASDVDLREPAASQDRV